jgi:hypothetical protein
MYMLGKNEAVWQMLAKSEARLIDSQTGAKSMLLPGRSWGKAKVLKGKRHREKLISMVR